MRTNKHSKPTPIVSAAILLGVLVSACTTMPYEVPVTGAEMPAIEMGEEESSAPSKVMEEQMPAEDMPNAESVPEAPAVAPVLMPAAPPASERNLEDSDASIRSYEKRAVTGDNILNNLYERAFTSQVMDYLPDIDIASADITQDEDFFYFTITLKGADPVKGGLSGVYGIEFDRTRTGRGDLLVWAAGFQPEWTAEGVSAFIDSNGDVGGAKPILAEEDFAGDGYDTMLTFEGERVAQARLHPEDPNAVQIAVSRALMDNAEEFLWGAWAHKAIPDPSLFDYNDVYRRAEAGSPIKDEYYPLQELHSMDNTCRLPYGFAAAPTGGIPGMCISIPKPEKPESGEACVQVCYNFGNQTVCVCT